MIYNEKLSSEYGSSKHMFFGISPVQYKPVPTKEQYQAGIIVRYFAKKINENKIIEIDPSTSSEIDKNLYAVVNLAWKISGLSEKRTVNGIIEKSSVSENNLAEINRVKVENLIDLSTVLIDPLEFWRGH